MSEQPQPQLQMRYFTRRLGAPPARAPQGYLLRTYRPGDEEPFYTLMDKAGFGLWDAEKLRPWQEKILPEGWFVIVEQASGRLVATTMAVHNVTELNPGGGELGWVAADPAHAGRGLGLAVCAAVTGRLVQAGYPVLYLMTDDFRLPAIKTYLKLGWTPWLFREGMAERWQAVCETLGWPYTPEAWQ